MKNAPVVYGLAVFAVLGALAAFGCGDDDPGSGQDVGQGRPRVSIAPDKESARVNEKINLTITAKDGSKPAAAGSKIVLSTDTGSLDDTGAKKLEIEIQGEKGQATAAVTSAAVGVISVTAEYSTAAAFTVSLTFLMDVEDIDAGDAGPGPVPCEIKLANETGEEKPQIEADGESKLEITATVVWTNGASPANGTEVEFETTDGSFFPPQTDAKRFKAFTINGKAYAVLVASTTVNPSVMVTAKFLCGGDPDGGTGMTSTSKPQFVEFIKPLPRPRIFLDSDNMFVLANGIDKAVITATLQTADPLTSKVPPGTKVAFTTNIGGLTGGSKSAQSETGEDEKATVEFLPNFDIGLVKITANAVIDTKTVTADIDLEAIQSGSVTCFSVSSTNIGLKGSGHLDNTSVVFKVQDNQQNPMPRLPVDFTISNAPGGVYIVPTSSRTDDNGVAQTILYSGTVPTTVTVSAKTKVGEAACAPIVISTGIPNARFLDIACKTDMINVGGFNLNLIESPCTVSLADRFSNKIPFATKVFFQTEAGSVDSSAETSEELAALGTATVSVRTSDPRPKDVAPFDAPYREPRITIGNTTYNPRDGLLTVIVATTGEEEFDDENGNGQFDDGEAFVDLGEPFVDNDDDGVWQSDERFIDWNENLVYDGPNGTWDGNAVIWKPTWLLWTGDVEKGGDCMDQENSYSLLCWDPFDIVDGGSMDFVFSFKDFNLNPINTTGKINVNVVGPAKIIGTTDFKILPTRGVGIKAVRTPDPLNAKIIHQGYEFGPFSSGYVNGFLLTDGDSNKEPEPAYLNAKIEYDYDPSKPSTMPIVVDLWATGLMDSTTTTGKCGVKLDFDPDLPVPADGVAAVTLTARPRGHDGLDMPDTTRVTWITDAGIFPASGSKYFVTTTSNAVAMAVLTNVEAGGTARVTANFECNDPGARTYQDTIDVVFLPITISLEPGSGDTTMLADGQDFVTLSATVTDTSRHAVSDDTVIRFTTSLGKFKNPGTSHCINTTIESATCDVKTVAGQATADLVGGYVIGTARVEASLLGSVPLNTASISLNVIQLDEIEFVNASRNPLGVKYSGYQETAEITFKVADNNKNPIQGQRIDFSFTGAQSGMSAVTVNPTFAITGADGLARTTVSSGTLAGTVQVIAKGVMGSQIVTSESAPVDIVGAKASRKFLVLECERKNVGGFGLETIDVGCQVLTNDRFINTIGVAQPVLFQSEAGYVVPVANLDTHTGVAQGGFRTSPQKKPADVAAGVGEPSYTVGPTTYNPRDGLVTIIAAMRGEEEFDDFNGNGVYDAGERFVDQGEPFVDANDDNVCDPDPAAPNMVEYNAGRPYVCIEEYLDVNGSGKYDPANGVWDGDAWIWQSWRELWTGAMSKAGDCAGPGPNRSIICPASFQLADGGSQHLTYEIKDIRLNPLPASTKVDIITSDVTLIGKTGFNLEDSLGMTETRNRSCNAQGRCVESITLSGYTAGYQGSFDVADGNLGDSGTIENINVIVDVNYSFDPSSGDLNQHDNLISQGALNDPNAEGPCAFKIEADPPSAVANGRDTIQIMFSGVRDQSGGTVPAGTALQVATDHGTFSNGRDSIIVLTDANGDATTGLLVGNEPGVATIQASFNCNGTFPSRQVQVVLLDPAQIGQASISLVAGAAKVLANGVDMVAINAFAFQASGLPAPDGTPIAFSTTASTFQQSGTQAAIALTTNGMATVDLNGGTSAGLARVKGDYNPDGLPNNGDEVSGTVEVQLITLGSIQFVKVEPSTLGVKHSGYNESGSIQFKVLDNNGDPFPEKQQVSFTLSDAPGGVSLISYTALTNLSGMVSTVIISGTVATTVTVTASADMLTTRVTGVTSVIPIVGAKPSQKYITIGHPTTQDGGTRRKVINFDEPEEGLDYSFVAFLGDRYSNKIERPVQVHFRTEAGTITPAAQSADSMAAALNRKIPPLPADVPPVGGELNYTVGPATHNPRDGLMTMIAVTTGEEEFYDNNGDGDFTASDYFNDKDGVPGLSGGDDVCKRVNINPDTGECSGWVAYNGSNFSMSEPFIDMPEPFVDVNDNWLCDPGEPFFDTNLDGYCGDAGGNTGNNQWDKNTNIWAEGFQVWTWGGFTPNGTCLPGPALSADGMNIICDNAPNFLIPRGAGVNFVSRVCDMNFNPLMSESTRLSGLWSTLGETDNSVDCKIQIDPGPPPVFEDFTETVATISTDTFELNETWTGVEWVKQPITQVLQNARINGQLQPSIYVRNQVIKVGKTVTPRSGCVDTMTTLTNTLNQCPAHPTKIQLDIVDETGDVWYNVGSISGTAQ